MTDFVLVHGAWCGSWTWDPIVPLLETEGHRVFAPTLTGLADRAHILGAETTRDVHVQDICKIIEFHGLSDIVLVGFSYGGAVISEVAEAMPDGTIGSIVFLDALLSPFPPEDFESPMPPVDVVDGMVPPPPPSVFGYDNDSELGIFLAKNLTPMPAGALFQPLPACPKVEAIPTKTYILASETMPTMVEFHDEKSKDPSWRTTKIDGRHFLMFDNLDETADMLLEAAR